MQQEKPSFGKFVRAAFRAFRVAFFSVMLFELVFKVFTALVANPLLSFLMQTLLRMNGDELAFNDGIWRFALSVPGIAAVVLRSAIAVLLIYFEFAIVITLARQALETGTASLKTSLVQSLWSLRVLWHPGSLLFALYALLLLPVVNMGVASSVLPQLAIPNFITGELTKNPGGEWLLLGAGLLLLLLYFFLLFVLPAMVLEHLPFTIALKRSRDAIFTYRLRMLGLALAFGLLWAVLFLLPRQIFDFFFGAVSVSLRDAITAHGFSLQTPIMLLLWLAITLLQTMLMPLLLFLLVACFLPIASAQAPPAEVYGRIEHRLDALTGWLQTILLAIGRKLRALWRKIVRLPFVQKHKKLLVLCLVLILAWEVVNRLSTSYGVHDPIVIAHRGSAYGVENTLPAIQEAIDAGADYTEVDVLLSADGVPMVMHDTNLQRLAGQGVNVYDLTADALQQIPLAQNGYTGTIPTLEEVVDFCEGKILLAVEYKLHGHEELDLVTQVMRVMEESEYQKNSMFLSLDYGLVAQMKTQYPAYRAGYCVYGNVGQPTYSSLSDMRIDFLLIEEWMANRDFLDDCRKAWLPVYIWTANDEERMDDYLRIGAAGLVTDYPDRAVAVLGTMYDLSERRMPLGPAPKQSIVRT